MQNNIQDFIAHARQKGMDHATIRMLLLSAGWKEKDIAQALTSQSLDMPVPLPPDGGSARDAFFHLLTFACLYTTLVSVIVLLFSYIDRLFPDPALQNNVYANDYESSGLRWWMAAVIVMFPLFLWLSTMLVREMERHSEKAVSGVRRWLTYLTLFVAALALLGDGITLVFRVLDGELTVRFLIKVLIIAVLTGSTFTYYLVSLVRPPRTAAASRTFYRGFAAMAAAIVLLTLVWGFIVVGNPATERERKFDDRRVEDLRAIQNEITNIVYDGRGIDPNATQLKKPLPRTLVEVEGLAVYQRPNITDPQRPTEPYEYVVESPSTYRLCAMFTQSRDQQYDVTWNHPAGRHCYMFDVQKTANPLPGEPKPAPVAPVK